MKFSRPSFRNDQALDDASEQTSRVRGAAIRSCVRTRWWKGWLVDVHAIPFACVAFVRRRASLQQWYSFELKSDPVPVRISTEKHAKSITVLPLTRLEYRRYIFTLIDLWVELPTGNYRCYCWSAPSNRTDCETMHAAESARQSRHSQGCRGKSGLHRARCQVTPGRREPTASATESKPPNGA